MSLQNHELPTKRQREAIYWAGAGKMNKEIAVLMHISESTVIQYLVRAFATLEVHTRQDAYRKLKELENESGSVQ